MRQYSSTAMRLPRSSGTPVRSDTGFAKAGACYARGPKDRMCVDVIVRAILMMQWSHHSRSTPVTRTCEIVRTPRLISERSAASDRPAETE